MMDDLAFLILVLLGGWLGGLWIGAATEARRWRANADRVQRIESAGRLYKVERA